MSKQPSTTLGTLFIVSAASGTGKTTLVKKLLETTPDIRLSVSFTPRNKREGEQHGVHYFFVSVDEFQAMVARNAFYEHAIVHGNCYGTSREWVNEQLNAGIDVILEIDWQGAAQMRQQWPDCRSIFILPPDMTVLEQRLRGRGTDSEEVITKRLAAAKTEISHCNEFDYIVVNDDFDVALNELQAVFTAERCRTVNQLIRQRQRLDTFGGA